MSARMERGDYQRCRIGLLAAIGGRARELGEEIYEQAEDVIAALTAERDALMAAITHAVDVLAIGDPNDDDRMAMAHDLLVAALVPAEADASEREGGQ